MPPPSGDVWVPIPRDDLAAWNTRLLRTTASIYQYPYWNEPYRPLRLSATYLLYGGSAAPHAYVCLLSLRVPGGRIGLVLRGPVLLDAQTSPQATWERLREWARAQGYIFVRFSHPDSGLLDSIAAVGRSDHVDPFPFFRDTAADVLVDLRHEEPALFVSFSKNAQRDIRRGDAAGYEVREEAA